MDIYRPQSDAEKDIRGGGFKDIRSWKQTDIARIESKKITDISHACMYTKREPFCLKCAFTAMNDKIEDIEKQIKNKIMGNEHELKINFNIDYNKFGGRKSFELLSVDDINETHLISGMRQPIVLREYHNYECKTCGSKISIQFEKSELKDAASKTKI